MAGIKKLEVGPFRAERNFGLPWPAPCRLCDRSTVSSSAVQTPRNPPSGKPSKALTGITDPVLH